MADFLICQYTVQYTSCILCEIGGILSRLWKGCVRNFTVAAGFLLCQYTVRMLGQSWGKLKVVCTDFVYLMDNVSGF